MNEDLEGQLKELGPGCLAVVNRLRAAKTVEPHARNGNPIPAGSCGIVGGRRGPTAVRLGWPRRPVLIAASLLLALALSAILLPSSSSSSSSPPYGAREYRLSPAEMIATQHPDGGWQNDFLTRRNAEALAKCEGAAARIAYKKALRNLRSKGIL